jgi:hypothetical protein
VFLDGYGDREGASTGIHDPLLAQVLALQAGEVTLVLVSLDLLAVDASFAGDLRNEICDRTGVRGDRIFVASTHTHGGPEGFRSQAPAASPPNDPEIAASTRSQVIQAASSLVQSTIAEMEPALIGFASRDAPRLGTNRLDPKGPMDDRVTVIRVEASSSPDRLLGLVVHYTCHPTVLGHENRLVTSDYPHFLREKVQNALGGDLPVLFLNGAAGDISTRFTRKEKSFAEARRIGGALGMTSLSTNAEITLTREVHLNAHSRPIQLTPRPLPDEGVAQRRVDEAQDEIRRLKRSGADSAAIRGAETQFHGARAALALARHWHPSEIRAEIQSLRVNELALVAIPGELFLELGLEIERRSPFPVTRVVGYANGHIGYIPTGEAYHGDGYEARRTLLAAGEGEKWVVEAVSCLKALWEDV